MKKLRLMSLLKALVTTVVLSFFTFGTRAQPSPTYAARGDYPVGTTDVVVDAEATPPLEVTLWYPALNPDNREANMLYPVQIKDPNIPANTAATIAGRALGDAAPAATAGPFPLVVLSHGFSASRVSMAYLAEHLASHGFVVMAPDHGETFDFEYSDLWWASIQRPADISAVIDLAETLNAGGEFAGLIDLDQVAVAGHSIGGYTALAAGGARFDFAGFDARCAAARAAADPNAWLCDPLTGRADDMAGLMGLAETPTGLWPALSDPRVDAIISMAGDSYLFDQAGLAEITLPVLVMGGDQDFATPYAWGALPTYQHVSSSDKTLVTFEAADHMIFATSCEDAPYLVEAELAFLCSDSVWEMGEAHALITHFTTAFLFHTLKADVTATAALMPDPATFPRIRVETTLTQADAACAPDTALADADAAFDAGEFARAADLYACADSEILTDGEALLRWTEALVRGGRSMDVPLPEDYLRIVAPDAPEARVDELADSPDLSDQIVVAWLALTFRLVDADALAEQAEAVLAADDSSAIGHYIRGAAYIRGDDAENGLAQFALALEANPDDAHILGLVAQNLLFRLGDSETAAAHLETALAADPDAIGLYYVRAVLQAFFLGDEPAAIATLGEALARRPDYLTALNMRADLYLYAGDTAGATPDVLAMLALLGTTDVEITADAPPTVTMTAGRIYRAGLSLEAGQSVTLSATSVEPGAVDSRIMLLSPDGVVVAFADDIDPDNGVLDALLADFSADDAGEYTVLITHGGGGSEGEITITLDE